MRRIVLSALALFVVSTTFAQADTIITRTNPVAATRVGGSDHFMIQFGLTRWAGKPDSIETKGFSRTFNMYFMFDFPFRTNPKLSVALGPGIATDHMLFNETDVDITANTNTLLFRDVSDTNHFEKFKVSTAFLELPVELRFSSKPYDNGRSIKVALGAKVATMLSAWTKGKTLVDKNDQLVRDFIQKEKSKRFFNTTRLSVTGRIGYGHFSLFGSYALTPVFKEGVAPTMRPFTIGLTLSGL